MEKHPRLVKFQNDNCKENIVRACRGKEQSLGQGNKRQAGIRVLPISHESLEAVEPCLPSSEGGGFDQSSVPAELSSRMKETEVSRDEEKGSWFTPHTLLPVHPRQGCTHTTFRLHAEFESCLSLSRSQGEGSIDRGQGLPRQRRTAARQEAGENICAAVVAGWILLSTGFRELEPHFLVCGFNHTPGFLRE